MYSFISRQHWNPETHRLWIC